MMAFAYIITETSINQKYLEQVSQLPSPIHPLSGGRDPVEKSCLHSLKRIIHSENLGRLMCSLFLCGAKFAWQLVTHHRWKKGNSAKQCYATV